jgi:hypothetical protein
MAVMKIDDLAIHVFTERRPIAPICGHRAGSCHKKIALPEAVLFRSFNIATFSKPG